MLTSLRWKLFAIKEILALSRKFIAIEGNRELENERLKLTYLHIIKEKLVSL